MSAKWQFWIDRGGTFTDVLARAPDGGLKTAKLLSENPGAYADAAIAGMRRVLGLAKAEPLPAAAIQAVKMGTTVATNALLQRQGEDVLLVTNRGFADALRIGYQDRPSLFDRHIQLPDPIQARTLEVDCRLGADGREIKPLDEAAARAGLAAAHAEGIRAVAIVLMHGYRHTEHERALARLASEVGFTQISASNEVSPLIKLVARGDTTVVDAYLSPILGRYVAQVAGELGRGAPLMFMQSNGGLTHADLFRGKDSILSGPAGGVVGATETAMRAGFDKVITFDMGGTSTDVAHFAGRLERAYDARVAGVRLRAPVMRIHTVAAGGGSILQHEGGRFRVGPASAGADPGPACYGKGGPPTVTDANLVLGRLQPAHFPHLFGPEADQPLDLAAARAAIGTLASGAGLKDLGQAAEGFLAIAVENMANAIKRISVERGHDVSRYALACFGGAGGQHACRVADILGMETILIHPLAGMLSALGMGLARLRVVRDAAIEAPLAPDLEETLADSYARLGATALGELEAQGVDPEIATITRQAHLRYAGTDTPLEVDFTTLGALRPAFEAAHRTRFGFHHEGRELIVEQITLEAMGAGEAPLESAAEESAAGTRDPGPVDRVGVWMDGETRPTAVFRRIDLAPGQGLPGPAMIIEDGATTLIEPGWHARIDTLGNLVLSRAEARPRRMAPGTRADPVRLELFNNLFMSIAEQMGAQLANTASSVNIKERLDFSCALFDASGALVANAPHLPAHLGSMGESVRTIIAARGETIRPGQVFALNAPYAGGTHLPDLTVIAPLFDEDGEVLFFMGTRGHHADIGGTTPGSMPPDSQTIEDEGVLIENFTLVDKGQLREAELRALLASGPYPARNPDQNLADTKAQIAACETGLDELNRMIEEFGLDQVRAYMGHVRDNARESVCRVLDKLPDGGFEFEMDEGSIIRVAISVDREARRAKIDFTGTSAQTETNFNAPAAVCRAAVLYVFRCLVEDDIPLNDGCLDPLDLIIPEGSLIDPKPPAAVVAGNVETSQCIAAALFGATGALAASQSTMNNVTFGNARHQYYETICGGAGAGPGFHGASAVHTHMTNTRLTDPEVLEWRHPVRLDEFRLRPGSGGAGRWKGGDGVVRRLRFLEPMTAAVLSNSRRVAPFGLEGGEAGQPGRNFVERADGTRLDLGNTGRAEMEAGDVLVIETPGGGGFGKA